MHLIRLLIVLGVVVVSLFVVVLTPYTVTALPECRITITNPAGKPVDNAEVYETGMYEFGPGWAEKRVTDREGKVVFPARTYRTSLMQRTFARLMMQRYLHMPSRGPMGLISVCDEGKYAEQRISDKSDGNIKFVMISGPCRRE